MSSAPQRHPCVREGLACLTGTGAVADLARGVALIEQAAAAGDAEGAFLAATLASSSFWRMRNWEQALDHLTRAAKLGHEAARSSLRILAGGPSGEPIKGEDWRSMRDTVDLATWFAPPSAKVLRESPRIRVIKGFAGAATCDWLIERARQRLGRATIYDRETGGTLEDERRTNSQCDLDLEAAGVLTFVLRARIAGVLRRSDQAMEVPKILHYAPGETFAEHYDWLDPDEPAYAAELAQRGQRTDTFLIYLNEGFDGGATWFPELELSWVGSRGDAILFSNVDAAGAPDPATRHAGLPPTSGEKWLFSQWVRQYPR